MGLTACLDAGNTRIKAGIFTDKRLTDKAVFDYSQLSQLQDWLDAHKVEHIALANVSGKIFNFRQEVVSLQTLAAGKVEIDYESPENLGADRLAAAVGAAYLFPGKDLLVIDAGTCITCDLFTGGNHFRGGSISPGLQLRFRSLNDYTGLLPLLSPAAFTLPGNSTRESILAGVMGGVKMEIEGFISYYLEQYPQLLPVIAGGDAALIGAQLRNPIFAEPDLVLYGLHALL